MQTHRLRRLRRTDSVRRLLAGVRLDPSRFVLPIFVGDDVKEPSPLSALPGHYLLNPKDVGKVAKEAESAGIPGLLIFGVTDAKDERGSRASAPDGPIQRALSEARQAGDLVIFADTCLCGYTSHGHCGIVGDSGEVLNDKSVEALTDVALSQAAAGADFVSPSDMMDGRVQAIRKSLDAAGLASTGILSYSAKFASAMYGPFRDVAGCAPSFGDRRGYQIDGSDRRQAIASMKRDLAEGADIVMVKPALAYLDVIQEARQILEAPVAAYNVSGEYAMVKAAGQQGWMDEESAAIEILTSIVRAGADFVITYHALEAARWLEEKKR